MLTKKIEDSLSLIRKAENLALHMQPERGFWLAFSGGKDSQCIYHLAKMAGVRFEAHYSLTTLDPPELVRFIRSQYPDVVRDRPEKSFVQLCLGKGIMPTRVIRFCCSELKESQGKGFVTMIGIRKEESARRGKRNAVERTGRRKADRAEMDLTGMQESGFQCVKGSDRFTVAPILEWTHEDVWDFLNKVVKVPHCELYDKGRTRLGCLFCPMSSLNSIHRDEQEYPKYKAVLMRMIRRMIEAGCFQKIPDATPEDVWEWWISKESVEKYLLRKKQAKLF